jgi:hypothetical protein
VCVIIIIIMIGTYGGMQRSLAFDLQPARQPSHELQPSSQPAGNTDDADGEEKEIVGLLMVICNNK